MERKKNRRAFIQGAALAVAAPLLDPADVPAQDEKQDPRLVAARNLTEIVRARHGKHLTEGQLKQVQNEIARSQASARVLQRTSLENGDEPAFIFSADVQG